MGLYELWALVQPEGGAAPKEKFKNTAFGDTMTSRVLGDLRFSLIQLPKSADDQNTGIWKDIVKTYKYAMFLFYGQF
jgi:hypothetical protein